MSVRSQQSHVNGTPPQPANLCPAGPVGTRAEQPRSALGNRPEDAVGTPADDQLVADYFADPGNLMVPLPLKDTSVKPQPMSPPSLCDETDETEEQRDRADRETEHIPLPGTDLSLCLSVNTQPEQYLAAVVELADRTPLPLAAQRYQLPALRRLVSICHALQTLAGDAPFHLSCRIAAMLLGGINHQLANGYLWRLVHDGVLTIVRKGISGPGGAGTATRYRYVGAGDQASPPTSSTIDDPGPYADGF